MATVRDKLREERLVMSDPDQRSNLTTHALAYAFALPHVQGKKVLDLCCGTGYGAKLMAEAAESVTGLDYSETTIAHASQWKPANCRFILKDVEDLMGKPYDVDVVTCFQGLEHLKDPKKVIEKYRGKLFIYAVPMGLDGGNKHHHHSIDYDTLVDWFGPHQIRYMEDSVGIFSEPREVFQNYFGVVQL